MANYFESGPQAAPQGLTKQDKLKRIQRDVSAPPHGNGKGVEVKKRIPKTGINNNPEGKSGRKK